MERAKNISASSRPTSTNYSLPIKKFVVLTNLNGPDKIIMVFDDLGEKPFPNTNDGASALIETKAGYGLSWLKKFWNPNPELIEVIDLQKK